MTEPNDSPDPRDMSDYDLLAAYEHTSGSPENADANALLSEIERRGLDV